MMEKGDALKAFLVAVIVIHCGIIRETLVPVWDRVTSAR